MSDAQREILESLAKSQTAAHREVTRAKALLLAADGLASTAVAYEVGVSPSSVVAWRSRLAEEGLAMLGRVRPGRGRKPQIPAEQIDEIVRLTQESKPEGETHWSCRSMAKAAGVRVVSREVGAFEKVVPAGIVVKRPPPVLLVQAAGRVSQWC